MDKLPEELILLIARHLVLTQHQIWESQHQWKLSAMYNLLITSSKMVALLTAIAGEVMTSFGYDIEICIKKKCISAVRYHLAEGTMLNCNDVIMAITNIPTIAGEVCKEWLSSEKEILDQSDVDDLENSLERFLHHEILFILLDHSVYLDPMLFWVTGKQRYTDLGKRSREIFQERHRRYPVDTDYLLYYGHLVDIECLLEMYEYCNTETWSTAILNKFYTRVQKLIPLKDGLPDRTKRQLRKLTGRVQNGKYKFKPANPIQLDPKYPKKAYAGSVLQN